MTDIITMKEIFLGALRSFDADRDRSQQRALGPSAVGSCRRQSWYRLHGEPAVNAGADFLPAAMGSALHEHFERALAKANTMDDYMLEVAVEYEGVTGHVDFYSRSRQEVWDWKTITQKKAYYFPTAEQVTQVQMYGLMLSESGYPVKRVGLLGVCRDGGEADVVEWSGVFDPVAAREGFKHLSEVTGALEAPEPQRDPVSFCRRYCEFFGTCTGKEKRKGDVPALDPWAEDMLTEYLTAKAEADRAGARLDAARAALEGCSGVSSAGVVVGWASRQNSSVDRAAVEAALGFVPMKEGRESLVLTVRGAK